MTTDHVFREAIAIATCADRRRLDASNNDEIGGEIGAKILAALRRKGIPTTPILRRPGRVGEGWGK